MFRHLVLSPGVISALAKYSGLPEIRRIIGEFAAVSVAASSCLNP